jgi:hypothetical protein
MKLDQQTWENRFGVRHLQDLGLTFQGTPERKSKKFPFPSAIELTLPQGLTLNKVLQLAEKTIGKMTIDSSILCELGERRLEETRVIVITDKDLPKSKGKCSNEPHLEECGCRIPDVIEIAALSLFTPFPLYTQCANKALGSPLLVGRVTGLDVCFDHVIEVELSGFRAVMDL